MSEREPTAGMTPSERRNAFEMHHRVSTEAADFFEYEIRAAVAAERAAQRKLLDQVLDIFGCEWADHHVSGEWAVRANALISIIRARTA